MNLITLSIIALSFIPGFTTANVKASGWATKVIVQNECIGTEEKFLAKYKSDKIAETNQTVYMLDRTKGSSYPIVICTSTQCFRYGNMTFLAGREYIVKISNCNLPGIRIESQEINSRKSDGNAKIRFRSRRVRPTEYRYNRTRFRRLSVGMSKYKILSPDDLSSGTRVQFRYRIKSDGPVSYMSTHRLTNIKPGRRYFVEVEYFGNQKEVIKIQDEGIDEK